VTIHDLEAACDRTYTASYHGGLRAVSSILWLVLHDTEGSTAEGAAAYFAGPEKTGSAHFCIDANHCYRTLDPDVIAYAAFDPANEIGLHFEQAGFAAWTRQQWLTIGRGTIERTAYRVAYWSKQLGIPLAWLTDTQLKAQRRKGVTTHRQITRCFPGPGHDHTDPGPNYPQDVFMTRARCWPTSRKGAGMAVGSGGINYTKAAVEFWYSFDPSFANNPVTVVFVNEENEDVGEKKDTCRGLVSATYKAGFEGEDHVTVVDDASQTVIAEFDTGFFRVPA
jgi:hypothetical protein